MLAVNQINAQIKLSEMRKSMNDPEHPIKMKRQTHESGAGISRSTTSGILKIPEKNKLTRSTFICDAIKAWNLAPPEIKNALTYMDAKMKIKTFVKNLPV